MGFRRGSFLLLFPSFLPLLNHYIRLVIGLFGLVGLVGIAIGPLIGRFVQKLVPWYAVLIASFGLMITQTIYTAAAKLSVAAVVVVCIALGAFIDMQQVALSTRVFEYAV